MRPIGRDEKEEEFVCVPPAPPAVGAGGPFMYFSDGTPTIWSFAGTRWNAERSPRPCKTKSDGQLQIARWETLFLDGQEAQVPDKPAQAGKEAYMQRGFLGKTANEAHIRHGHVLASDLVIPERWRPLVKYPEKIGRPAPRCDTQYLNRPQGAGRGRTLPDNLYYKPHLAGSKWSNYGDQNPAAPGDDEGNEHYNYLLWTWPVRPSPPPGTYARNPAGGLIRAAIPEDEPIRGCDVEPAYLPAFKQNKPRKKRNVQVGTVKMQYGVLTDDALPVDLNDPYTMRGGKITGVYGWFVHSWRYNGKRWNKLVVPG